MTVVNTETGEVLDVEAARRITQRIQLVAESLADNLDKLAELVGQARETSAWLALGYRSWTEYVSTEFAGLLPRLDREPRRELVAQLAGQGMSTRGIAPVVGLSREQVRRDLSRDTNVSGEVGSNAVTGMDGKTYPRPDHRAKADEAVDEFPDLAYFRDRGDSGDLEHTWRLADSLREFRQRGELDERIAILRRSIEVDRSKRDGTYVSPTSSTPTICAACGQQVRN